MDTTLSTLSVLHPIIFPVIRRYLGNRKDDYYSWQGINKYSFDFNSESNESELCEKIYKLGIPFNMSTDTDRNMDGEDQYYRFTSEGEVSFKRVYQTDRHPSLATLKELKNDHAGLIYYINCFSESVAVPSWDNQIAYGRIHRARVLING
jgi:hypothetical protein